MALRAAGLAEMGLFEGCTPEQLQALAERLRPVRAEPGQVLMRQGEQAVSFVLIHSGRAAVSHTGDDGEVVLDEVGAGAIVGEIALLRDKPRTATVTATEALSGYLGDKRAFALMADLPGSANDCCGRSGSDWPPSSSRSRWPSGTAPVCCSGRCCPVTASGRRTRRWSSPVTPFTGVSCPPGRPARR